MENNNLENNSVVSENEEVLQFLTFNVDENEYAVDIMSVMEIRGWQESTRIPNSPEYMLGVINLRGQVIPVFDLRIRFVQGKTEAEEKHVIIVLNISERTIGILVDSVSDIINIKESEIRANPTTSETSINDEYVKGLISHEDKMIIILDVEYLFDKKQIAEIEAEVANK